MICDLASLGLRARRGEGAGGDGALLLEEDAAAGAGVAPRVAAVPQQDLLQGRRRKLLKKGKQFEFGGLSHNAVIFLIVTLLGKCRII